MVKINENYLKLHSNYLFIEIGHRVQQYIKNHPDAKIIKLGIGDTTEPLIPAVIHAFHEGVEELSNKETYKGYPPNEGYQGYPFLRNAILHHDYEKFGVSLDPDEIFVSDGAKSDTANILDIFGKNIVAITDPCYPAYVDTNVMAGNTGEVNEIGQYEGIVYIPCNESTGFKPRIPEFKVDLIYLCSPNNPTGTAFSRPELKQWVDYARENQAIIIYDGCYERYITQPEIPHTIYEIQGAKEVAIEIRSLSKTAGFTGVRCGYMVIPKPLVGYSSEGKAYSIHTLWNRRMGSKFNGLSYPVQKAAAAVFSEENRVSIDNTIRYYQKNAAIIREGLDKLGFTYFGGVNAPYIWLKAPNGMKSWEFFDLLLNDLNVVGTPGSGFGPCGEGYFRITAFGDTEQIREAMGRISSSFKK